MIDHILYMPNLLNGYFPQNNINYDKKFFKSVYNKIRSLIQYL